MKKKKNNKKILWSKENIGKICNFIKELDMIIDSYTFHPEDHYCGNNGYYVYSFYLDEKEDKLYLVLDSYEYNREFEEMMDDKSFCLRGFENCKTIEEAKNLLSALFKCENVAEEESLGIKHDEDFDYYDFIEIYLYDWLN